MSNLTSASDDQASASSHPLPPRTNPDPDVEVIALSVRALTSPCLCEECGEGFQRGQYLQLHRRGHKRQRNPMDAVRRKVYLCPEPGCVHHDPARAGDLRGIRKHFARTHGEKMWKCEKCSKRYAVMSDWKAHSKLCGKREYHCYCGTLFSRRDSFIEHRAFCDAAKNAWMLFAGAAGMQQHMEMPGNVFGSARLDDQEYDGGGSTPESGNGNTQQPADLTFAFSPSSAAGEASSTPHRSVAALLQNSAQMAATLSQPSNQGQMASTQSIRTNNAATVTASAAPAATSSGLDFGGASHFGPNERADRETKSGGDNAAEAGGGGNDICDTTSLMHQ